MKYTTLLFAVTLLFVSNNARAEWKMISSCDDGAAVFDSDGEFTARHRYQLVIRNAAIVKYLTDARLAEKNEKGEVLIEFNRAEAQSDTVLRRYRYNLNLKTPVIEELSRTPVVGSLKLDIYSASNPTGGLWEKIERIGGWNFQNCSDQ